MPLLPDGRILLAGSTSLDGGITNDATVARFLEDGSLDTTFGSAGVTRTTLGAGNAIVNSIAVQADGKIIVAGGYDDDPTRMVGYTTGFVPQTSFLIRYGSEGELDPGFGDGGKVVVATAGYRTYYRVAVTAAGILASGFEGNAVLAPNEFVERYDDAGHLDPTFGSAGVARAFGVGFHWSSYFRGGLAVQPDGRIVVADAAWNAPQGPYLSCAAARFDASGQLDATFGTGGLLLLPQKSGSFCNLQAIAVQADGRIVLSGGFQQAKTYRSYLLLTRREVNGAPDRTFGIRGQALTRIGRSLVTTTSHAVAIAADGSILQGGSYGGGEFDVVRHNARGKLDRRFGPFYPGIVRTGNPSPTVTAVFDGANAVTTLPDGRILVGGNPGHDSTFGLARYVARSCTFDGESAVLTCP